MSKNTGWTVPKIWKGERCFIIAGGPSVEFDGCRNLKGRIIAIKHSVLIRPDADVMFWAGAQWHRENPFLIGQHRGEMLVKRKVDATIPGWIKQVSREPIGDDGICGFGRDAGYLGGLCAGGAALNLAASLGATRIILVGYDFTGRHWFPGHPAPIATDEQNARHQISIERMADPLAELGVKVVNASLTSRLTCFPRARLGDFQ